MEQMTHRVKPIIFSGALVRALIEGRKTQTRRVLKPKRGTTIADCEDDGPNPSGVGRYLAVPLERLAVPYAPGDLLYLREAHYVWSAGNADGRGRRIDYRATTPDAPCTWSPSIHMPRWASRLTLAVTDVRLQRLNDISDEDAMAEGVRVLPLQDPSDPSAWWEVEPGKHQARTPSESFARLWKEIHGPNAWGMNPWVVAVTFDVHKVNVDHFAGVGKKVGAR
jgi:hypothetical protein